MNKYSSFIKKINVLLFILIPMFGMSQDIYQGKKEVVRRVYVQNIIEDKVLVEIGGTTLKAGGDYIELNKITDNDGVVKYVSNTNQSYLIQRKRFYKFYHYQNNRFRTYKLKKEKYSEKIDNIRFSIFRGYDYFIHSEWRDSNYLHNEFEKFKKHLLNI